MEDLRFVLGKNYIELYFVIGKVNKQVLSYSIQCHFHSHSSKAMAYTLGLWVELVVYVEGGRLLIDNNRIENTVRPKAIGRKNYLVAGSYSGAEMAAMLYTFMGSCKMHKRNPQVWLTDILKRLPTHPINKIDELLPPNWKPAAGL